MSKVFLGGTCAETVWREKLISMLRINYFNPVVDDWTEECIERELYEREHCDYCLYVITPSMQGVYSIAEVVDDSNKKPNKTIFCVLEKDICREDFTSFNSIVSLVLQNKYKSIPSENSSFSKQQLKSLEQVGKMVERNGGNYFKSLEEVANYLNNNKGGELNGR